MKDIDKAFKRINQLIQNGAKGDAFEEEILKLFSISPPESLGSIYSPGELYRATNHHKSMPTKVTDLLYPPPEKAQLGRANKSGEPMFYCADLRPFAVPEIKLKVGMSVVIATWVSTSPFNVHDLGFSEQVFNRAGTSRPLPEHHKVFNNELSEENKKVRDFIATAFTEPSDEKYELTSAIAKVWLGKNPLISGLCYPSISTKGNNNNFALRPDFVDKNLKLKAATMFSIREISSKPPVGIQIAEVGEIGVDGLLKWVPGNIDIFELPKTTKSGMFNRPVLCDRFGKCTINGKLYNLAPGYMIKGAGFDFKVFDLQGDIVNPIAE